MFRKCCYSEITKLIPFSQESQELAPQFCLWIIDIALLQHKKKIIIDNNITRDRWKHTLKSDCEALKKCIY